MNSQAERFDGEEIEAVFAGTGLEIEEASKCDDECVGGSANTKAMEATKP